MSPIGDGSLPGPRHIFSGYACPDCHGSGSADHLRPGPLDPCRRCGGRGLVPEAPAMLDRSREGWRAADEDDSDRIIRRVGAALNSGRDKAVVQVVIDETDALRREMAEARALLVLRSAALDRTVAQNDELRAIVERVRAKRADYQRLLDVAIDEENLHWLPAIIGSLDLMLDGPL